MPPRRKPGGNARPLRLFRFALLLSFFLHLIVILGMQAWFSEEAQREIRYPVLLQGGSPGTMRFTTTLPPSGKDLTAEEGPLRVPDLLGRGPAGIPGGPGEGLSAITGAWIPGASSVLEEPGLPGGKPGIFASPEEPRDLTSVLKEPLADMDLPLAINYSLNNRGEIELGKLLMFLVRHPADLPSLIKLGLHFNAAKSTLKSIARQLDKVTDFSCDKKL